MHVLEAIESRRAIKQFDPQHRLTAEEERTLLGLALLSPTAFNVQHWRFVLVKDPELRAQIRAVAWNQPQVTEASLLVVICANISAWKNDPARYWRNAPKEAQDILVPAIQAYYQDNAQAARDEVFRSTGIAAQTLMLAAKGMGYDSCPMDGFDFAAVGKLINLPEDHVISMFVVIGKRLQDARPRPGQLDYSEVVLENKFS